MERAAAELRRLAAVEADYARLMEKHNNLHANAATSRAERDALREALAAHDVEQAAKAVPADLRRAAERTRQDLGPTGSNYPDVRVLLAFAEQALDATPPAPESPPDTEAVSACWQDFGRTNEFRRAVKWSQDGDIPGALFVAFRAGLRAASPKALCDCGKKPAAECDKWEPGCDLGCSPEHARVVRLDKAQAAPEAQQAAGQEQDERAAFEAWATEYSTIPLKRDDDASLGFTGYTEMDQTMLWDAWQAAMTRAREQAAAVPLPDLWPLQASRHKWVIEGGLDAYRAAILRTLGEK